MTTYLLPAGFGEAELVEKRSRFIGRVWPVETEAEALEHIEQMRKQHHDARHNCFAYCVRDGGLMRYSDDSEPQGTAGQPILNVFRGREITNFCCVVTRYFGGILLGTGGLVRAYSEAAKLALEQAGLQQMARWQRVSVRCPYNMFERVKRLLTEQEAVTEDTEYGADICITALLREDVTERFSAALRELSAGGIEAQALEERFCGVRIE